MGKTLGVALDLDVGMMRVSIDGGEWIVAFSDGCAPSAIAGASLFPAVSGGKGAEMRFNWGLDEMRPLKHAPPSGEYLAVGQASKVPCPRYPFYSTKFLALILAVRIHTPQPFPRISDSQHDLR